MVCSSDVDALARRSSQTGTLAWGTVALVWLSGLTVMMVAGCGRHDANVVPVSGRILFNGLPARATISSQPVDAAGKARGRPSWADTRPVGTFTLQYTEQQSGAVVGPHRVQISIFPVERAVGEFDFQERFRPVKVVELSRQVKPDGDNQWNLVLKY